MGIGKQTNKKIKTNKFNTYILKMPKSQPIRSIDKVGG